MRHADVAIVGAGLAGATAAAMLGRSPQCGGGIDAVVIDPAAPYPTDFRSEKIAGPQLEMLRRTGLAGPVLRAATGIDELWIARFGHLVEKRRGDQYGILYDTLVNTVRAEVPAAVEFIRAKVSALSTGPDRQTLVLSTGEEISARLIVLATGLNNALRRSLGIVREELSKGHSISIGFDVKPLDRPGFDFRALTYFPEHPRERMSYLTLFPIGAAMRANLFGYWDMRDPWLKRLRETPEAALLSIMPRLGRLTGSFAVSSAIELRPVDLYVVKDFVRPGVVLVGDAFATSCPAAGTGVSKVFTDVERLCNLHIGRWLASPGMGADKIAAFYADPVKQACDAQSAALAWHVRAISIDQRLPWRARRAAKFAAQLALGTARELRARLAVRPPAQGAAAPMPPG